MSEPYRSYQINRWLVFFQPKRFAPSITKDSNLYQPFIAYAVLTFVWLAILFVTGGSRSKRVFNPVSLFFIVRVALMVLTPLLFATASHGAARMGMGIQGPFGRLVRLFYYAEVGHLAGALVLGYLPKAFPNNTVALLPGPILALWSLIVFVFLVKDNYTVTLGEASMLTFLSIFLPAMLFIYLASMGGAVFLAFGSS